MAEAKTATNDVVGMEVPKLGTLEVATTQRSKELWSHAACA